LTKCSAAFLQNFGIFLNVSVDLNVAGDIFGEGQAHWNIACSHMAAQDKASALEAAMLAHNAFLACLGAEHPQTQQVKGAIESIQ
jgi:hypothetical protein